MKTFNFKVAGRGDWALATTTIPMRKLIAAAAFPSSSSSVLAVGVTVGVAVGVAVAVVEKSVGDTNVSSLTSMLARVAEPVACM